MRQLSWCFKSTLCRSRSARAVSGRVISREMAGRARIPSPALRWHGELDSKVCVVTTRASFAIVRIGDFGSLPRAPIVPARLLMQSLGPFR
jgi:hypothetical protein